MVILVVFRVIALMSHYCSFDVIGANLPRMRLALAEILHLACEPRDRTDKSKSEEPTNQFNFLWKIG